MQAGAWYSYMLAPPNTLSQQFRVVQPMQSQQQLGLTGNGQSFGGMNSMPYGGAYGNQHQQQMQQQHQLQMYQNNNMNSGGVQWQPSPYDMNR
jgi:hypothetical protein